MSLMSDALRAFTRPLPPPSSSSRAAFSERSGENNSMLTSETRATRAVRILCLNYFAQKRCSREGEKENRDGEKEGADVAHILPSYLRFHGALKRCESSLRKRTHRVVFFDGLVADLSNGMQHALRNEMKRALRNEMKCAACQARKCENPKCGSGESFLFLMLLLLFFQYL